MPNDNVPCDSLFAQDVLLNSVLGRDRIVREWIVRERNIKYRGQKGMSSALEGAGTQVGVFWYLLYDQYK